MELEDNIDVKKIVKAINNLTIKKPPILVNLNISSVLIKMVSVVQLVYDENGYRINRYYITCSNNIEIVLDRDYEFHALNIFKNNICYSHDLFGNLIHTYTIKENSEDKAILIIKSNGEVYNYPDKEIKDFPNLEIIRRKYGKELLCYCKKIDGRFCFYIRVRKEINYKTKLIFCDIKI